MPLMELTLQYTYANQVCLNRFNYLASGTPAAVSFSFALAQAFGAIPVLGVYPDPKPLCKIAAAVVTAVSFDQILVKDVYSDVDFYETPFVSPLIGAIVGETLSPAVALGFRSNRIRSDIRRGMKRFSGMSEGSASGLGLWASAYMTGPVAALGTALGATLSYDDEGNTLTFAPTIVGKQCYHPSTGDACVEDDGILDKAYRYYPTFAAQDDHLAVGVTWDAYPQMRTQTSRQYGHGT